MKQQLANRAPSIAVLLGVLAIAVIVGPVGPLGATALSVPAVPGVVGFGFWGTLGCVGCIAGFIIGAGATVAGLAVFLAANPEIGILCVSTCAAA
jgi:hypothetical protein